MRAGQTAFYRKLEHYEVVNASDYIHEVLEGAPLVLTVELRNDTFKTTIGSNGALTMRDDVRRKLLRGFKSDKDECTGWNALVGGPQYADLIGSGAFVVVSQSVVRLTLPANLTYSIRVPETVRLTVPGDALTSGEDIHYQQPGEPDNEFRILPDAASPEERSVLPLPEDGTHAAGELEYFAERWYTIEPVDASVVLRVDAEYDDATGRYGALDMQVYEDPALNLVDYTGCGGATTTCGDGTLNNDGTRNCRCLRNDMLHGTDYDAVAAAAASANDPPAAADMPLPPPPPVSTTSSLLFYRNGVKYATPSIGYAIADYGTARQRPRGRLYVSLRCVVDVCNGKCRYNISATKLPHTIDDGDSVTAPLEAGSWHYFRVPLSSYDVLALARPPLRVRHHARVPRARAALAAAAAESAGGRQRDQHDHLLPRRRRKLDRDHEDGEGGSGRRRRRSR